MPVGISWAKLTQAAVLLLAFEAAHFISRLDQHL